MLRIFAQNEIKEAADILKNGGIVAIPTETVYGLAANAFDEKAVKKIFKAKGRPSDNPLIVHISSIEELDNIAYTNEKAYELVKRFWPGPLTIILPKKPIVPYIVTAGLETVAVRFPSHPIAKNLIEAAGVPLAAPSANLSGKPSGTMIKHIINDFGDKIDGAIDGGECVCGVESTVVSLVSKPPVLLRPGFVTPEQLRQILPDLEIAPAVLQQMPENTPVLSPGLKHKHYAPKATAFCVTGETHKAAKYININSFTNKNIAVICFDGEEKLFSAQTVMVYGKASEPEKMARNIFGLLRKTDDLKTDMIFIRTSLSDGIGLAVYNRLLRACNFNVIDADKVDLPFILGLTGQSGAGKSTAAHILENYGFKHIDTDKLSREAVYGVIDDLKKAFGNDIVDENGELNRKILAKRAFSTHENTDQLNSIIHKQIMDMVRSRILDYSANGVKRVVVDGAALIEADGLKICDSSIAICADDKIRLNRIIERDKLTESEALLRFNAQKPRDFYTSNTDFTALNDNILQLETEIRAIMEKLKSTDKIL